MAAPVEKGNIGALLDHATRRLQPDEAMAGLSLEQMKRDLPQDDGSVKVMIRLAEDQLAKRAKIPAATRQRLYRDD